MVPVEGKAVDFLGENRIRMNARTHEITIKLTKFQREEEHIQFGCRLVFSVGLRSTYMVLRTILPLYDLNAFW